MDTRIGSGNGNRKRNGKGTESFMTTETRSQQQESNSTKQAGAKKYAVALAGRFGPFIGLFLVIATFAILTNAPSQYLSATNLRIVLSQTVIVAIGAIGMTIIIIS